MSALLSRAVVRIRETGFAESQDGLLRLFPQPPLFVGGSFLTGNLLDDRGIDLALLNFLRNSLEALLLPQSFALLLPQNRLLDFRHVLERLLGDAHARVFVLQDQGPLQVFLVLAFGRLLLPSEPGLQGLFQFLINQSAAGFRIFDDFYDQTRGVAEVLTGPFLLAANMDRNFTPVQLLESLSSFWSCIQRTADDARRHVRQDFFVEHRV